MAFGWKPAVKFVSLGMIKEGKLNDIDRVQNLMLEFKAGFITQDQYYTELEKIGQNKFGAIVRERY